MKLNLFLLLLAVLLLSHLGLNMKEYFTSERDRYRRRRRDGETRLCNSCRRRKGRKYILKSKIVPPVCPKCPDSAACPRQKPCPACPPCARCPESPFTCEKVPNYLSSDSSALPRPILSDFSQFGM